MSIAGTMTKPARKLAAFETEPHPNNLDRGLGLARKVPVAAVTRTISSKVVFMETLIATPRVNPTANHCFRDETPRATNVKTTNHSILQSSSVRKRSEPKKKEGHKAPIKAATNPVHREKRDVPIL